MSVLVLDPYSYDFHEDPDPAYARLRADAPAYRNDEHGLYALSRHADVVAGWRRRGRTGCRRDP